MGIQKDAGELLVYIYKIYTEDPTGWTAGIGPKEVLDTTKWDAGRINRTFDYLREIGAIKYDLCTGNVEKVRYFSIKGLTPVGIGLIEDIPTFKKTFGFEVNLGLIKFSWQKAEK